MSSSKLQQFQAATEADTDLSQMLTYAKSQWPDRRSSVPHGVHKYWNLRNDITEEAGVLFFGDRIIVPPSLRQEMLSLIHESHLGENKCKARARLVMYWPGMTSDIEEIVRHCAICARFRNANAREPLIPHSIPERPWQKIGTDIMTLDGVDYLVCVDYLSKFPEIASLRNKTASTIVQHLKSIFARHGIPETIVSDNMPFGSQTFAQFVQDWGIELDTSSPTYAQSNGQAERIVQTTKKLLEKAQADGKDMYIALMEYRNTPVTGTSYSPAQMLMSRTLRTKIPTRSELLQPKIVDARSQLETQQANVKGCYDRGTKDLTSMNPGDHVYVRVGKVWEPACIISVDRHPRSYWIDHGGSIVRRNRKHLRPAREAHPYVEDLDWPTSPAHDNPATDAHDIPAQGLRRGSRVRRPPNHLSDYVSS
jgi:transposase InsO family protein